MAAQPGYSERLEAAIARSGDPKRTIAKRLAARTGNSADDERSALYRYLKGTQPNEERARLLAEVLNDPTLAELDPRPKQRLEGRLEALEAEVAQLREERDSALEAVVVRLAALEGALAHAAPGSVPRLSEDRGTAS